MKSRMVKNVDRELIGSNFNNSRERERIRLTKAVAMETEGKRKIQAMELIFMRENKIG